MSDTLVGQTRPEIDGPGAAEPAVDHPRSTGSWTWQVIVVAVISFVLAAVLLRPFPLSTPVMYRGDAFQHDVLVQSSTWWGSVGHSSDLGGRSGIDWSVFPTGTERLQLVVLHALDALTGDVSTAINLYLLLGVMVTAAVTFVVLRWMGLRPLLGGATAVAFTFAPAFGSAVFEGHLFLYALYPVALGTWLALWATMATPLTQTNGAAGRAVRRREVIVVCVAVVTTALSSAYYTAFGVVVIAAVGLAVAMYRRDARRLLRPAVVIAGLVGTAGLSLLPDLLARAGNPAAGALRRTAVDVWRYSLHPRSPLLLGDGHPLAPLARLLRARGVDLLTATATSVLGLVALSGCIACLVIALRSGRHPRDRSDRVTSRLAVVVVTVLLVAMAGGLATVAGQLGFTQIRAWGRMAVFLSFAGLAGLALVAQRWFERDGWERRRVIGVLVVAVALTLVDQGIVPVAPVDVDRAVGADAALVRSMVGRLGRDAAVFELPVVSFPDDPGSERLLAPAVQAGGALRFSAGFFRGGREDWQLSWCRRPVDQFVRAIAAVGYDALLVQRTHHMITDRSRAAELLDGVLGTPAGQSRDGTFVWYDLRPLRSQLIDRFGAEAVERAGGLVRRPVGIDYRGVTDLRLVGREMDGGGDVLLRRLDGDTAPVRVTMRVTAAGEARVVEQDVRLRPDVTTVPVPGAPPVLVNDVSVIDTRALDDPVLGPADGPAVPSVCM